MKSLPSQPVAEFLTLLRGVVEDGNLKWKAYCPVHEATGTHDPSLGVTEGDDGKVLLKCLACPATTVEIVHAAGSTMSRLFPKREGNGKKSKSRGRRVAEYVYRDAEGIVVYRAERWEKTVNTNGIVRVEKTFCQSRPNGHGGWSPGVKGIQRVLYRLPELIAAPAGSTVFVVEGEKKVEQLNAWGLIATCNVGGAGKWNKSYSRYLMSHNVVILPDNDPVNPETGRRTGYEHARDVIVSTQPMAKSIRILELPGLPPKGDIVDWAKQGGTLPELLKLLEAPINTTELSTMVVEKTESIVAQIQDMDPLDLRLADSRTDAGNARRLIRDHGQDLKYCHPWGKWLIWEGRRWKIDDTGEAQRRAISVSDKLWVDLHAAAKDIDETSFAKIQVHAKYSSSVYGIEKMLECAASLLGSQILPKQLDSDPWLLNAQNGTIDLRTGVMREHERSDLITKIAPTAFDPDARCDAWDKFFRDIFPSEEVAGYVRRLCGYWSTGVIREQILPVLFGTGSNGKTTFLNGIMKTLGPDYTMKAPAGFLMAKHGQSNIPTDKADLFGQRFVVCSETDEGKKMDESLVKELTGDEDLRVRRMREDFWQFTPTHKIALITNHKPVIRGTDHGIWRRIRLIPFSRQFWNPDKGESGPEELRQDSSLKDRLDMEHSGILTWIVRACIEWATIGESAPAEIDAASSEYKSSQDLLGSFLEEVCEVCAYGTAQASQLYNSYKKWTDENGEYCVSQRNFGVSITERGFEKHRNNGIVYLGIKIKDEMEQ